MRGPPLDPPEEPPTECVVCGSPNVVPESYRNGGPACEMHYTETFREHERIQRELEDAGEAMAHISMMMDPEKSEKELDRLKTQLDSETERAERLRKQRDELQAKCDHDHLLTHKREVTVGGESFVECRELCPECGYRNDFEEETL